MKMPDAFLGKRMIMGMFSVACVTGATIALNYDGETFLKLIGLIVTAFMTAQTITDSIGK